MSADAVDRLIGWAEYGALRCTITKGATGWFTCDDHRPRWYKPGYAYPCVSCARREELLRWLTR